MLFIEMEMNIACWYVLKRNQKLLQALEQEVILLILTLSFEK